MIEGFAGLTKTYGSFLVWGFSGTGKSWFLSTFPDPYMICTERIPINPDIRKRLGNNFVLCETQEEVERVVREIAEGKRAQSAKSILFDSWTELAPLTIDYVTRTKGKAKMTIDMWGIAVDHTRTLVSQFTNRIAKTRYVVSSARVVTIEDTLSGTYKGLPASITKNFSINLPGLFDYVLFAENSTVWKNGKKEHEFIMNTLVSQDGKFNARDGSGQLAPEEPNDFSLLLPKIEII